MPTTGSSEYPECAFDQAVYDRYPSEPPASWGANTAGEGWLRRDFSYPVALRRVMVWSKGSSTEQAGYRIDWTADGVWDFDSGWIPNVPCPSRLETVSWEKDAPVGCSTASVKLGADLSKNWTGLWEVALLADLLLEEALQAPEWALPDGESFAAGPVLLRKPASWSGHNPAYWPDPDAWWVWATPGADIDAPAGTVRFRLTLDVPELVDALLYVAADDGVCAWLDGVPVLYWNDCDRYAGTPVRLSPGRHVFSFEAANASGPAGLLVSLGSRSGQVIARSGGAGWETSGYVR